MTKRSPARPVFLKDIVSTAFLDDDGSLLNPTLRGHLAIEALLTELLSLSISANRAKRFDFADKVRQVSKRGLLPAYLEAPFLRFNDFRNDFVHIFGFETDVTDIHDLARELEKGGLEFSDSVGQQPLAQAAEAYGGERGILAEVLWCLLFEVAQALADANGRDLFGEEGEQRT